MRIRMLETRQGSLEGLTLRPFEKGQVYDLSGTEMSRSLAGIFLRAGWAEEEAVKAPVASPTPPEVGVAPEVAALPAAPENKAAPAPHRGRRR